MTDLSVLIPARNEMFLQNTIDDVLAHATAETEVIVVLDGYWPEQGIPSRDRLTVVHVPESIGQRAATNLAARLSDARYIMKLDAHCSVAKGFDEELIRAAGDLGEDVTQIPAQYNLHVFDWVCSNGHRRYQGPSGPCEDCGAETKREMVWKRRRSHLTTAWRFDGDLHFQYWREFSRRPEGQEEITETMSCLGACWFMSRERFWKLGGLDEDHGSWGQMGTELACKSWLSGGRMVCNKRTWFAHLFRTQGGDFSFPYELKGRQVQHARKHSQRLWKGDKWPGAVRPLSWLIEHFAPVPGWEGKNAGSAVAVAARGVAVGGDTAASAPSAGVLGRDSHRPLTKGVVYYSDCRPDPWLLEACFNQLHRAVKDLPIVLVTLGPLTFPRVVLNGHQHMAMAWHRGILTMFRQILAGLEALNTDVAFLAEHDMLYHPSHFEFTPPKSDVYYYNENVWKVDANDGKALFYWTKQTSGLCANRLLLVEHYHKRIAKLVQNQRDLRAQGLPVKRDGYSRHMGFEPGCHRYPRGVDSYAAERWMSAVPNIDIRHGANLTPSRWSREQFRSQRACEGWREAGEVPGWGVTKGRFSEFLRGLR